MAELKHPIEGEEYLIAITYSNGSTVYETAFFTLGKWYTANNSGFSIDMANEGITEIRFWEFPKLDTGTIFEA